MKTDKIFYHLFLHHPDLLAELLPGIPEGSEFDYSAQVVKAQEFRHDGVFTPRTADPAVPMVFIEAQMQPDPDFYGRFFAEIYLHLKQYPPQRPWRGLLLLKSSLHDLGSEHPYQLHFAGQVQRLYLLDLLKQKDLTPNLALLQLIVLPKNRAAKAAQTLLQTAPDKADFKRRLELIEAILVSKFPQMSPEEILKMLNMNVADFTQTRFFQDVFRQGENIGRQEGRQEGRQDGIQEGEAGLIIRLLKRRCGLITPEQKQQILTLPIADLERLGEALLDFTGASDLQDWLKNPRKPT